jgi:hypothetical protein
MKTLKITLLLLAVVLLTVSGQSSDIVNAETETTIKKDNSTFDLLAVNKKELKGVSKA